MGYSSVKGGLEAISAAELLVQHPPLAADETPLDTRQLQHQLSQSVDKVMSEGGLYAPELAALALKQAEGDLFEAAFLLRAYRSTLPRFGYSLPTRGDRMRVLRRISSAFKDVPGGQLLGRTRDYTQRLLDFSLLGTGSAPAADSKGKRIQVTVPADLSDLSAESSGGLGSFPKVADAMRAAGLVAPLPELDPSVEPPDITIDAVRYPASRPTRLQMLARGESGAMLSFAYSSLRAFGGGDHATVAELRVGDLPLQVTHPLLGQPVTIGYYRATEAELLGPDKSKEVPGRVNAAYSLSYGLTFGQHERKAISMAILDSTLMATEGEERPRGAFSPAGDQEMVLSHIDPIESSGFVEHLKLPHYVTFGASLQGTLALKAERAASSAAPANGTATATDEPASTTNAAEAVAAPSPEPVLAAAPSFGSRARTLTGDDHGGIGPGQLHHHGDGVLHAHDA
jgi:alpha-D-ribose 1-methylphosphonate 5-triphosphate synthase subunit PhnI